MPDPVPGTCRGLKTLVYVICTMAYNTLGCESCFFFSFCEFFESTMSLSLYPQLAPDIGLIDYFLANVWIKQVI